MGLMDELGRGPIGIDSTIFIYLIEESPEAYPHVLPLFEAIDAGILAAVTSAVTLLEVLVVPYRHGAIALAERYEMLLRRSTGIALVDLSLAQLRLAARLRADLELRTPDALQVAAGLSMNCTAFVTNDRRIPAYIRGMRVLKLRDFLPARA